MYCGIIYHKVMSFYSRVKRLKRHCLKNMQMASTNANDDIAGNSKLGKATSPVKINIQSFTCLRTNLSKYEIQTVKSG